MKKVIDITNMLEKNVSKDAETKTANPQQCGKKVTNPIYKKMADFINAKPEKKFSLKDLFR